MSWTLLKGSHNCNMELPPTNHYSPGAIIKCDVCGQGWLNETGLYQWTEFDIDADFRRRIDELKLSSAKELPVDEALLQEKHPFSYGGTYRHPLDMD